MYAAAVAEEIEDLSVTESLRLCAAFEDKSERLACFEALAAAAAPPARAAAITDEQSAEGLPQKPETSISEAAAASLAEPSTAPSDAASSAARGLEEGETLTFVRKKKGEAEDEKKSKSADKNKRRTLTVYKSWRNGLGELRVAFTNGEIWIETSMGTDHDPQRGDLVDIKPRPFGGWQLSFQNGDYRARMRPTNKFD